MLRWRLVHKCLRPVRRWTRSVLRGSATTVSRGIGRRLLAVPLVPILTLYLSGCTTANDWARLGTRSPAAVAQLRAISIRSFATGDDERVRAASAQVLGEMGFTIADAPHRGGFVFGFMDQDAKVFMQIATGIAIGVVTGVLGAPLVPPWDATQTIHGTVVASRPDGGSRTVIRVAFDRSVLTTAGEERVEFIDEPSIYAGFFARLAAAIGLDALPP